MAAYDEKPEEPQKPGKPPQEGRCEKIAAEVNEYLVGRARKHNNMKPCDGAQREFKCEPLQIPDLKPWTTISWGDSKCDCIEGSDEEIMYLTVCNPYSNLTLVGFTVEQLKVVDENGKDVLLQANKKPCIQLVPIGPYCFGDIPPCSCVTRQFFLHLQGAPGGKYKILLRGMCFEVCVHADTEGCFAFEVCED